MVFVRLDEEDYLFQHVPYYFPPQFRMDVPVHGLWKKPVIRSVPVPPFWNECVSFPFSFLTLGTEQRRVRNPSTHSGLWGTPPYPRHGGMRKKSQDKRIRKPKFEKGQERKLKGKENKENKCNFILNVKESVRKQ